MDKFDKLYDSQLKNIFENESKLFDQDAMWLKLDRRLNNKKMPFWVLFLNIALFLVATILIIQFIYLPNINDVAPELVSVINGREISPTLINIDQSKSLKRSGAENSIEDAKVTSQMMLEADIGKRANSILYNAQRIRVDRYRQEKILLSRKKERVDEYSTRPLSVLEIERNSNSIWQSKNISKNNEKILKRLKKNSAIDDSKSVDILGKYFGPLPLFPISAKGIESLYSYSLVTPAVSISDNDWSQCRISQPWSWYLEGYGGYSLPNVSNTTRIKDEPLSESYLSEWDAVQSVVGGYQGGIQAIAQSPSGIEFGLGLEYIKVIKKLSTSQRIIERISIYDPMAYFYRDSINNIVWVGDTVSQTVITDQTKTSRQSHSLWNIPIRIGYMHRVGDWNFGLHSGVIFNLKHSFEGTILRKDGSFVVLESDNQESVYKKSLGVSFLGDLYLGRQLNETFEIFVRPEFRYYPKEWTTAAHPLTSKVHLSQVQLGFRYRIE